jgi:crossover junction endodeoxyribonuclease RuvC
MTTLTIGVDPGKAGAIAALDEDGRLVEVVDMPCTTEVSAALVHGVLAGWEDAYVRIGVVVVEEVAAFPKNGSIGNFKLGMAYGIILGVVGARWPLVRVRPAVWKRSSGLTSDKDRSRTRAIDLWPAHAATFARRKDDGRAEAALLARWHQQRRVGVAP